ncbi:MAG: elongation factor Ts [Candidatus Zixiibacteriota bacterium]|nr:MAG: elongation factor Ts [candidate division Zixibacteria bacterium]
MNISAGLVKKLREKTGAGMMDCKKALQESDGDIEKAVDHLRKQGIAKAAAKSQRTAREGLIAAKISPDKRSGVILELNCETDFVARTDDFKALTRRLIKRAEALFSDGGQARLEQMRKDESVSEEINNIIAKLGENINLSRLSALKLAPGTEGKVGVYVHPGDRLGVLVVMAGDHGTEEEDFSLLLKDMSMQIAAANPSVIEREELPPEALEREREIYSQLAKSEGKPEKIIDRIVSGRMEKYYQDTCLLEQSFIKDQDKTVRELINETARKLSGEIKVQGFLRFRLGESVE